MTIRFRARDRTSTRFADALQVRLIIHDALHSTKDKAEAKFIQGGGKGMLYQGAIMDKALDYGRRVVEAARKWASVVDQAVSGKLHPRTILQMGQTPDLLVQVGLPALPLVMERSTLGKVLGEKAKRESIHNLTPDQVKALYADMAEPVAVLHSDKAQNAFVILTSLEEAGNPVLIPVHVNVQEGRLFVNTVATAFGKTGFEGWFLGQVQDGNLLYLDKTKTAALLKDRSGLDVAGVLKARRLARNKLFTEGDVVKPVFEDIDLNQDAAPGESRFSDRAARDAGPRAGIQFLDDGRAIIHLFRTADASSINHETGHLLRRLLPQADQAVIEKWCGVVDGNWTRDAEEKFAKGFEVYCYEGKAPTSRLRRVFSTLRNMLVRVYGSINNIGGVQITPEVRQVFDRLVSTQAEREAEAQAADALVALSMHESRGKQPASCPFETGAGFGFGEHAQVPQAIGQHLLFHEYALS